MSRFRSRRDLLPNSRRKTQSNPGLKMICYVEDTKYQNDSIYGRPVMKRSKTSVPTSHMSAFTKDTHHKRLASAAPCLMINGIC